MIKAIYNFFHNHYHRKYHGVYEHAKQLFVFDMFLLGFAILMFGSSAFFFTWKPSIGSEVAISISLGSERIKSGSPVHLSIDYTNNSKQNLNNAILALRLPQGFIVDEKLTSNLDLKNHTITIGSLPPGSHGSADIYGTLWSNINETEKLIATLSFKPEGNTNIDQSSGIYLLTLTDSVLHATLNSPSKTFSNQKIPYSVDLINTGNITLSDIRLNINGKMIDKVFELPPNATTSYSETFFTPTKGGNYLFTADTRVIINGKTFIQSTQKNRLELFSPRITLSTRLQEAPPYAEPLSILPVRIMWKNDSQFSLKNQKIIIQTTPGVVDLALTATENHLTKDGNNLIINEKTRTTLSDGKPNSGDQFDIKIYLLPNFDKKASGIKTLTIKPVFEAEAADMPGQAFTTDGSATSISLSAEVFLRSVARYYTDEGDQLGRGLLPPQVGKTTKYWIFTTLFDKINSLRGNRLIFTLAPGVTFTGKQSVTIGPELIFNQANRTMSWTYDSAVPADSESGFYFEVSVTPKAEQAGYILNLISATTYYGIDDEVGKEFNIKLNNTSNILPNTDKGFKNGAIVTP
ncbi:MAG: hypothetical protein WC725_00100 [Patescibacteria group bacterium]|jgi:hypothetical protein